MKVQRKMPKRKGAGNYGRGDEMAQKDKPWYENALLIAIAGSIIVVIGQLAGTVIPIM
jgi:hypothetical protein